MTTSAEPFLTSLEKVKRGVLPKRAQCFICKQEYGTVPSENGIIERAVRLPCCRAHVGSECIALWVRQGTNACPACPKELFTMPPRDVLRMGEVSVVDAALTGGPVTLESSLGTERLWWYVLAFLIVVFSAEILGYVVSYSAFNDPDIVVLSYTQLVQIVIHALWLALILR